MIMDLLSNKIHPIGELFYTVPKGRCRIINESKIYQCKSVKSASSVCYFCLNN